MKISANTAVTSQLSTLPQGDQEHVTSVLSNLLDNSVDTSDRVKRIPTDDTLFEIRITSRLRALVRMREDKEEVELLAIARPDQLERYIKMQRAT
jgi:hypothetical protein